MQSSSRTANPPAIGAASIGAMAIEAGEIESTLARHATYLPKITAPRTDDRTMHEVEAAVAGLRGGS